MGRDVDITKIIQSFTKQANNKIWIGEVNTKSCYNVENIQYPAA